MRRHLAKSMLRDLDLPEQQLAVIRPDDPKKAVALAEEIMAKEARGELSAEAAREAFNDIPTMQPYRFMGFLGGSARKDIVDEHGKVIGKIEPGDSFVEPQSLSKYPPN